jgi:hypothetical protein
LEIAFLTFQQYKVHMVQMMELQKWENLLLLWYRKNGRMSPTFLAKPDYTTIDHTSTPPNNPHHSGLFEKVELVSLPPHQMPKSPRNSNSSSKNKDTLTASRGRVSKSKTAFY